MKSEQHEWETLRNNLQTAFTNLTTITLGALDQVRRERELSDRLASVIWLLDENPDNKDELVTSALDVWREARQWRNNFDA